MMKNLNEREAREEFISLCIMYTKNKSIANKVNMVQKIYTLQKGEN
jgi:hypothetical protein